MRPSIWPMVADVLSLAIVLLERKESLEVFLISALGIGFHEEEDAPSRARRPDSPLLRAL